MSNPSLKFYTGVTSGLERRLLGYKQKKIKGFTGTM